MRGLNLAKRVDVGAGNGAPARVEEEREGGTGPRGRDTGGERPPGVAVWVAEGIIRVVLGVADSPCGCGV